MFTNIFFIFLSFFITSLPLQSTLFEPFLAPPQEPRVYITLSNQIQDKGQKCGVIVYGEEAPQLLAYGQTLTFKFKHAKVYRFVVFKPSKLQERGNLLRDPLEKELTYKECFTVSKAFILKSTLPTF